MNTPEIDTYDFDLKDYGYTLAAKVMSIDPADEIKLDPILNIAHQEVTLDVDNQILTLAAREDILNSVIVKSGNEYKLISEIGYMELGGKVAVFLCPGEFDPLLVYGGPQSGDAAWSGDEWSLPAFVELTDCEYVMVYGLTNDHSGYVLRDNEYHSLLSENEEVNVISKTAGSTYVAAFIELLSSIEEATNA